MYKLVWHNSFFKRDGSTCHEGREPSRDELLGEVHVDNKAAEEQRVSKYSSTRPAEHLPRFPWLFHLSAHLNVLKGTLYDTSTDSTWDRDR